MAHELTSQLDRDGFVLLPQLVTPSQLRGMQQAFEARLRHMAWNDTLGYERTEMYRHMIQDVLILDQGFLNVALHPLVQQVLKEYIGAHFQLVEAKGWRSLPTMKDFHGWHADAWYDQNAVSSISSHSSAEMITTDGLPFLVINTCSSNASTSLITALRFCRASASVIVFMYRILAI